MLFIWALNFLGGLYGVRALLAGSAEDEEESWD